MSLPLQRNQILATGRSLSRRLQLGRILYLVYYRPWGEIQRRQRWGIVNSFLADWGQQQMKRAALTLPPIGVEPNANLIDIYFLSGEKFWYQTAFCAYSLMQQSSLPWRPHIYDDGTLKVWQAAELQRIFPHAEIAAIADIEARVEANLPVARFPSLRERRANYPNLKKLIDIHVGTSGWKLVLDSDLLFFREPTFLSTWARSPQHPCHLVDVISAYGYSLDLMSELAGAPIPQRLNVGICGLNSDELDWEKIEFWCRTTIAREGTSYYQEQALIAMLMAGRDRAIAPEREYIVMPEREEVMQPQAVMHHYVDLSKPWYFRYGWKPVLGDRP